MATSVYIDGFNLYYGLLRGKANRRWLDPVALSARLLPGTTVAKIKYFTARVRDFDGSGAHQRQDVYLRALRTIHHLDIIESVLELIDTFYDTVVQEIREWQPPTPQRLVSESAPPNEDE